MKQTNSCVIVIPVHSAQPTDSELLSFKQCFEVLGKYPIKIIAPKGLNLVEYRNIINDFNVVSIPKQWQKNIQAYNRLKSSLFFYELFKQFDFLLTYELDAFVFRDELIHWCNKGFDYIGAPWFNGCDVPSDDSSIIGVGNSGFSLRKISTCIKILKEISTIRPIFFPYYKLRIHYILPEKILWDFFFKNKKHPPNLDRIYTLIQIRVINEDNYWSMIIPDFFKFNIASADEAIKFSFELFPERLFELNDNCLPFGCHAWLKYNYETFWKKFIKIN